MKKNLTSLFLLSFFLSLVSTAQAASPLKQEIRRTIKEEVLNGTRPAEIREGVKEEIKERRQNILEKIKEKIQEKTKGLRFAARLTGTLSAVSGNILTVVGDGGKTYTVNITAQTQLRRRFWGRSELSEFSVGDKLNVIGKWTDEGRTTIDARLIRNLSIQRRWGVFFGKVSAKGSDNFMIETLKRETQTVYFSSGTNFVNRKQESISYSNLQVDHRVRIKGVWDRTLKKIIEVDEIKDFSLPPLPTKVVTPTTTP